MSKNTNTALGLLLGGAIGATLGTKLIIPYLKLLNANIKIKEMRIKAPNPLCNMLVMLVAVI